MEKSYKVLVTDRDSKFLEIADEKLSGRGFKVIMSKSAMETIEYLKVINIDYILVSSQSDKLAISEFIKSLAKKPQLIDDFQNTFSDPFPIF